jgi:hypothetical protein
MSISPYLSSAMFFEQDVMRDGKDDLQDKKGEYSFTDDQMVMVELHIQYLAGY